MDEEKPLLERMKELENQVVEPKIKKLRLPRKAKVKKRRLKKGWIGIIKVDENGNFSGEKQRIEGSSYKTKDGTYHAMDGSEVGFWMGKFPVIVQQSWKLNPMKLKKDEKEANEVYGQKYVMARMLSDTIKVKKGGGKAIIIIAVLLIGGYFLAKYMGWIQ